MFIFLYSGKGVDIRRVVRWDNVVAVAHEAARYNPRMTYPQILGFLENQLKKLEGS